MLVLGIETSCDETAAAVVSNGRAIVSNIVSSQVDVHRIYGGVVPELASRHHVKNIVPVVEQALSSASITLDQIDGIAVTRGPGLVGGLLVGLQFAKALAYVRKIPLIGVHHLEGHLIAVRLVPFEKPPPERYLALLVSGGHTLLLMVEGFGNYRMIGTTRDDAAGEAFDKVAKLLSLSYPGGPIIERLAQSGDPNAIRFPRPLPRRNDFNFSFSGLKTAVANHVREKNVLSSEQAISDLCASFQQAVADVLVQKTLRAAITSRASAIVAAGGVLANRFIRNQLIAGAEAEQITVYLPPLNLCTDNAAMIAAAGTVRLQRGERSGLDLNAVARIPITEIG